MKNFFYAALFLSSSLFYSQVKFEQGYIINQKGEKIDGLIKNYDWRNNPTAIEFKQNENDKTENLQTINLNEFSVDDIKYVKAKVLIDRSSGNLQSLSNTENLNSKEEVLLLKTLVNGKISLYEYSDSNVTRFFYKKENEDIFHQLEYKEYMKYSEVEKVIKNEQYKNQLKKEFSDNIKIKDSDIEKLSYRENSLKKIFVLYNELNDTIPKNKDKNFHLYFKPGIGFSNYKILPLDNDSSIGEHNENSIVYRIGAELEYVLNFNKGKWSIISDPSFQTVKYNVNDYNRRNFEVKYSSIQIPVGIKHNMFLSQKSKIYLSGTAYYDLILSNDAIFKVDNISKKSINGNFHIAFAAGYNYDKFGIELKWGAIPYFTSPFYGDPGEVNMKGVNISLSYKIF